MNKQPLKKIMYIEDEPDIIVVAKIALEEIGRFEVKSCRSGREALEVAPLFKPDLFLIDVMMPELDGPSTLKELRKIPEFSQTPIIFITAKTQATEVQQYLDMGAVSVIKKPFDPMQLAATIRDIWEQKVPG